MSSLWTPSGEHRVPPSGDGGDTAGGDRPPPRRGDSGDQHAPGGGGARGPLEDLADDEYGDNDEAAMQKQVSELAKRLAGTPAEEIVANHCYGLFELGAIHLSANPPNLTSARLAIDALGALVDGLGDRLGEALESLREALSQIRLAYVHLAAAAGQGAGGGESGDDGAPAGDASGHDDEGASSADTTAEG